MTRPELIRFLNDLIESETENLPSNPKVEDFEKLRLLGQMKKRAIEDSDFCAKLEGK